MDFDEITQILEMMREHDLVEFELDRDNVRLRLKKHAAGTPPARPQEALPTESQVSRAEVPASSGEPGDTVVRSPIVGTYYGAPEPTAKPYVEVGDVVREGQVLCIIEAMKLMNEINADCGGVLVAIHVENGQAVQYNDSLFTIRPS